MKVKEVNGDKKQSTLFIYRRIGFSDKLCLSPATAVDDAKNTRIPETKDPRKSSIKKTNWAGLVYWIHHDVYMHRIKWLGSVCVFNHDRQIGRWSLSTNRPTQRQTSASFSKPWLVDELFTGLHAEPADHRFSGVLLSASPQTAAKCCSDLISWLFDEWFTLLYI